MPSVLWRCWLGDRKGIRPVKNWVVGCWHGCLERDADLHMAQLMPLPLTVSCFRKIQIGFTFLVPAHPGRPRKGAVKWVCVCVCVCRMSEWQSSSHARIMWQPLDDGNMLPQCRNGTTLPQSTPTVEPCQLLGDVIDYGCWPTAAAVHMCTC